MKSKRYRKKTKNNLYIFSIALIILVIGLIAFIILGSSSAEDEPFSNSQVSSEESSSQQSASSAVQSSSSALQSVSSDVSSSAAKVNSLDEDYSRLLLVNGKNPLPEDYNYTGNLIKIDSKYRCGWRDQMDKYAYPYATAMMEQAWRDNVELYVLSPYRSYDSQVSLFDAQVKRELDKGVSAEQAKINAATVVAAPGTSEHHTGLAIDFNSVEDSFENTEQFKWLKKNAEDYGFVLRYPKGKEDITGVIYEPWHWRFVGIKEARKMNQLDMCLEEYTEYLEKNKGKETE